MIEREQYLSTNNPRTSFTLIELLVAVAIIALLTMITIPAFSGFTKRQTLYQAAKDLKTELRATQNRTVSGVVVEVGSEKRGRWGIHFAAGAKFYEIFATTDSLVYSSDRVRATKTLPSNIPISAVLPNAAGSANVIFNRFNGEAGFYDNNGNPLTGSTLTVTLLLSGTPPASVIVERGGKIYEQ